MSETLHEIYEKAPPEEQTHLRAQLRLPSQKAENALWIMVVVILAGVIFVGVLLGSTSDGSDETALYGFVGLALGAVIGLLSPALNGRSSG